MAEVTDLIIELQLQQGKFQKELGSVQKQLVNMGKTTEQVSNKVSGLQNTFNKVGKQILSYGAMYFGARGIGKFFSQSISLVGEFENKLGEVSTLLGGKASQQIKKYETAIRELSTRTSASVNELTDGLYQVISAGVKGTETVTGSMRLLEQAQKTAVAGVTNTEAVVNILSKSLNAYGQTTEQAAKFSDIMFTTVKKGMINFEQLSGTMGQVVSIAANANVSFEEVNAALAAMTKGGIEAERASTALRSAIATLLRDDKRLSAALGVSANKLLAEKGLLGVMKRLNEVTGGSSGALKALGVDTEALAAFSVLAGSNVKEFSNILDEMSVSAGATDEAYKKMSETFEQQKKQFWNVIQDLMIDLGTELMPTVLDLMKDFSEWVKNNKEEIIGFFKGIATAIRGIVKVIKEAISFLRSMGKVLGETAAKVYMFLSEDKIANMIYKQKMLQVFAEGGETPIVPGAPGAPRVSAPPPLASIESDAQEKARKKFDAKAKKAAARAAKKAEQAAKKAAEALIKEQEKAREYLHKLELDNMDKVQKRRAQYWDDQIKVDGMRFDNEEDRERALFLLKEEYEKELVKIKEESDKKRQEAIDYAERSGDQALQSYRDMRAEWSAMAQEKWGEKPGAIESFFADVWVGFKEEIGARLVDLAYSATDAVFKPYSQMFDVLGSALSGANLADIQGMVGGMIQFWQDLPMNLTKTLDWLAKEGFPKLIDAFVTNFPMIVDAIVTYLPPVIMQIVDSIPIIIDAIVEQLPTLVGALARHIPVIVAKLIAMTPHIIASLIEQTPQIVVEFTKGLVASIPDMVKTFIDELVLGAPRIVTAIVDGVTGGLAGDAVDAISDFFSGTTLSGESITLRDKLFREWLDRGPTFGGEGMGMGMFHQGGYIEKMSTAAHNLSKAIRAHSGMYVRPRLASDEVPIIAQAGEGIIRREVVAALGGKAGIDAINRGMGVGGAQITNVINAQHMFAKSSGEVIDELMNGMVGTGKGKMYRRMSQGSVAGLELARRR